MDRFIEVTLRKRGVSCIARLLDDLAPRTCEAMWNASATGRRCFSRQVREQRGLYPGPILRAE